MDSSRDQDFLKALNEAYNFMRSDGSFTGNELTHWIKTLDDGLRERLLKYVIQVECWRYNEN